MSLSIISKWFEDSPALLGLIALLYLLIQFYKVHVENRKLEKETATEKVHKSLAEKSNFISNEVEGLKAFVYTLGKKIDSLFIHNSIDEEIDHIIESNLHYFKSDRFKKHLILNGDLFKKFSHFIINMGKETDDESDKLNEQKIDDIAKQLLAENNVKKSTCEVDKFLLSDYMRRTQGNTLIGYIESIKAIYTDERNSYNDRYVRLTKQVFDKVVDEMYKQYKDLVANDFDFDEEIE